MAYQIFQLPKQLNLDSSVRVQAGALAYFYVTGTTTPTDTYQDAELQTPHENPVECDASGVLPVIYLDPEVTYKLTLRTAEGALIYTVDPVNESPLSQSIIAQLLNPQTDAESNAGVTPTNYAYPAGDVRRYGPALDGTTDDTAALQRWASVGGDLRFPVDAVAKITAPITLVSDSTLTFAKGGTVETSTQNISFFRILSKTNVTVRGAKFRQTSAGNSAFVAGVELENSDNCLIAENEFEGMQWAGVYLFNSDNNSILNNYIHDSLASSAGTKSDIILYQNSSFNEVRGNRCFGGLNSEMGIIAIDPGGLGTYLPEQNKIVGNWVGDHNTYGIVVYIGGSQESYNQVIGNTVQNVTGTGLLGASGTGIYVVGHGCVGIQVINNIVRNCCISSTLTTNGPAGITVTDIPVGSVRSVISCNTVEGMTQGHGILVSGVPGGAVISSNSVRMPSANDGSGAGGAGLAGEGIRLWNSADVTVSANTVLHLGSNDAFFSLAGDASYDRINITGNLFRAASGNALRIDRSSTHVHTDCVISGNNVRSDDAENCIFLIGTDRATVTGNVGGSNTGAALAFNAATGTRVANNRLNANGTDGVTTTGTCTGSNFEKSNSVTGLVVNGASGFRIELLGSTPASGTYVAGDTVWHLAPAANSSPGAICTTGGSPGTWKAMANIAA